MVDDKVENVDEDVVTGFSVGSLLVVNESVLKADVVVISGVPGGVLSAFSWNFVDFVSVCTRWDTVNIVCVLFWYVVVFMLVVVDEKVDMDDVDFLTGLFVYSLEVVNEPVVISGVTDGVLPVFSG